MAIIAPGYSGASGLILLGSGNPHSLHASGTIGGVSIALVAGANGVGVGHIRSVGLNIQWKAPGSSTYGEATYCGDGSANHTLFDGEDETKWIIIQVTTSAVQSNPQESRVFLADTYNNDVVGPDVTAAEADAGDVSSWSVGVYNLSTATGMEDVRFWIDDSEDGAAYYEISLDDSTWVSPTSETHADVLIIPTLAYSDSTTLYVRRIIPSETPSAASVRFALMAAWDGQ